jgi:hypothetical protein
VLGRVDIELPRGGGTHLGINEAFEPEIKRAVFRRRRPATPGRASAKTGTRMATGAGGNRRGLQQPRNLPTGALPAHSYHQRDATRSPCKLQLDAGVLGQPGRRCNRSGAAQSNGPHRNGRLFGVAPL